MSALGLTLDDVAADQVVDIWPDCAESVNVFIAVMTQWRMGPSGPIGLDYGVLPMIFRLTATPQSSWPQVFADLQVMEVEALNTVRKADGR